MPRFNLYQALHTTVIGPEGRPLEIQIRTRQMHYTAEFGVAAHWIYKGGGHPGARGVVARGGGGATARRLAAADSDGNGDGDGTEVAKPAWLRHLLDWQQELQDPREFMETLKIDLFEDEVFVFTPKGEVMSLPAEATPLDFAYAVHTDVGHRCVGAKVNGKITPLHYRLQSGDIVEILTSKQEPRPIAGLALAGEDLSCPQQDPRLVHPRAARGRRAPRPRAPSGGAAQAGPSGAEDHRLGIARGRHPRDGVPQGRRLLRRPRPGEDLDQGRRQQAAPAAQAGRGCRRRAARPRASRAARTSAPARSAPPPTTASRSRASTDVMVRLAKCCRPVPGDEIVGYISLGRGITIHRESCNNVKALMKDPERFTKVSWDGRERDVVPRRAAGRRLGPHAAARGSFAHLRRSRRQHPRGALHRQPPDGEEPLRGRGGGHRPRSRTASPGSERRLGVRRLPGHARRVAATL